MRTARPTLLTAAAIAAAALAGCSGYSLQQGASLKPEDFRGPGPAKPKPAATAEAAPAQPAANSAPAKAAAPAPPQAVSLSAPAAPGKNASPGVLGGEHGFVMDAMVGQVNGRPLYASEIFRDIGEDTLKRIGLSESRLVFKSRAAALIEAKLRERITNSLILAEAQRGMDERMQMGLNQYMKTEREKVLAQYGGGAPGPAEQALIAEKGHGIDEELEQRRQKLLVDKFLHDKFYPKITVHRTEVERYYEDHPDEFNPNPTVTVRVIVVGGHAAADAVDKALQGGSFADVAKKQSTINASDGGLMGPFHLSRPMSEFNELKWDGLNRKVRDLKAGQWSDRTDLGGGKFGWIMLQKLEGGRSRTLKEAFLEIENRLRAVKINRLQRRYISDLFKHGNFTPVEQMGNALLDVAMVRYARPQ